MTKAPMIVPTIDAAAAREGGAAEDGSGDGVELVGRRGVGVGGAELGGEQQTGQRRAATGDDVDGELDPVGADAGETAARSLPPTANTCLPNGVCVVTTMATAATTIMIQTATGTPSRLPDADARRSPRCRGPSEPARSGKVPPLLRSWAKPRAT